MGLGHRRKKSKTLPSPVELAAVSSTSSHSSMGYRGAPLFLDNTISSSSNDDPFITIFHFKEIATMVLVILGFAGLSIFIGVAAGISISIHYFESADVDHRRLLMKHYGVPGYAEPPQRVTTMDPSIASSNSLRPDDHQGDTLVGAGHAVHTFPDGRKSILLVVDESFMMDDDDDSTNNSTITERPEPTIPFVNYDDYVKPPKLCDDGVTFGYNSWNDLKQALRYTNGYSNERYERWKGYFKALHRYPVVFEDDHYYYEEEFVFTICPNAVLRGFGPVFINTESVVIECQNCVLDVWGSHFSFGPEAKNTLIRGITFRHATATSLLFKYNGADVILEDCIWIANRASASNRGAVADVNSTSTVHFYRCFVSQPRRRFSEPSMLSIRQ